MTQTIDGFMLPVEEGSWWQFRNVDDDSYNYDTGTGADHYDTTFVLRLGAPTTIAGDQAFPVEEMVLASSCTSSPGSCTLAPGGNWSTWSTWGYLSFVGKRIRASKDGATYSVMFDANTGIWPATSNGFFGDFPSNSGTRVAARNENDTAQWQVSEANSSNDCSDVPGYGTVCGSSGDVQNGAYEDYDPSIGCVESAYSASMYSNTGEATRSTKTTLVDQSVGGDRTPPSFGAGCVAFSGTPTSVAAIAQAGSSSAPTGGTTVDGLYVATAVRVYGTGATSGTTLGTFAGQIQISGTSFQSVYTGSNVPGFYAAGSFSTNGSTLTMRDSCSYVGSGSISVGYSVTSSTTVDITLQASGYTSVVTYTRT